MTIEIKQAVILAGGLGTRLKPLTNTIPKPMIKLNNKPFLEYLIGLLKRNGIEEVVLLLGYLPKKITEYFEDGSKFGIKIKYSIGDVDFDTGKRIKFAEKMLDDHFLLIYCDNYIPLNLKKITKFYNKHKTLGMVTVYSNRDGITKSNIKVDENGFVVKYDKTRREKDVNGVEIGFFILDKKILDLMPNTNFSLGKDFLQKLIDIKQLSGFITDHRYYSIGNIERLPLTEFFLKPKKVIFLDRDGVINKKPPKAEYVKNWSEFEFLPGTKDALKLLCENGYDIYIISNQAGISRRKMSVKDLEDIHDNMRRELKKNGVKITDIYYCPHGWDEGCECRKPKPGMFIQACKEHHINISNVISIGDDERDAEAGDAADCKTILLDSERNLLSVVNEIINKEGDKSEW